MKNKITAFNLNPKYLEMWIHQNKAEYAGDFIDGSLLDNFVVATKRGFAAIYECYVNEWQSQYRIEFQPGTAQDVFRRWYEFEKESEKQAAQMEADYKRLYGSNT